MRQTPLFETAALFLRLGLTAFGGPAAHIAMMEEEVVRRRRWLSREQFLDLLGVTNLIPGPNSTELAIQIGFVRHGWPGLLIAGVCFIAPAALVVSAIAWGYVRYGSLPQVAGVLHGLTPVVIAIVAHAIWQLSRSAVKSTTLGLFALLAVAATVAGVDEVLVLVGVGLLSALVSTRTSPVGGAALLFCGSTSWFGTAAGVATSAATPFSLWSLFLVFLKIGSVLFGSGYVLLAFLRADFVERLGWLTERQLLDAIAVGQVTPGPLFTTATFIGYLLGGAMGATVATVGIFLPAFVFVAIIGPLVPRLRRSAFAGAALDGVNVASLALMAVVTWQLARVTLVTPWPAVLSLVSLVLLVRYSMPATWLIVVGAVVGWIASAR